MKHTTLTPPTLKIAIVSAILGLGAVSGANAQTQNSIDTEMDKILNLIENSTKLSDQEKKVRKSIVRLTYGLNDTSLQVADNRTAIEENKASLSTLTRKSFQNQADIVRNNASIDDLYEANNENVERLIEHDRAIQILAEAGNHHDDLIRNLYAFSNHQEEYALQQTEEIENLIQASSANTDRISTAELGIAENKKDALIAKAQADKNKNHIQDLAKAQLAGVEVMDELNKNVEENKADITKNKATLAQHTKKIDDNQRAIEAKLGGKVDAQKLVDLETKVDDGLKTVQENYSQLNTQVQSVDNKIGMVDTRVNALDDKVENSMAAQAALNGLFQPYNVGKVSVSAAVGAYGSKSAIAVGAGYRVNPHLAFKGGAAINTSGSRKGSYNLGINYEF